MPRKCFVTFVALILLMGQDMFLVKMVLQTVFTVVNGLTVDAFIVLDNVQMDLVHMIDETILFRVDFGTMIAVKLLKFLILLVRLFLRLVFWVTGWGLKIEELGSLVDLRDRVLIE